MDRPLWRTPFYWSFDASATGLGRSEPPQCSTSGTVESCTPPFRTANLLGRFDLNPEISLPLLFRGWSLRPELILHETYYTQRLVGESGQNPERAVSDAINRQAIETAVELRPPPLERVFDKEFLGRKWKHVIEPRAVYRFVTGVNNFADILKFDERDVLTDTHEVEYGFVTRLYAKRTSAKPEDCDAIMSALTVGGAALESNIPWRHTSALTSPPCQAKPQVHEIATWELEQKYFLDPTFGGALISGQRNVFTTTADLTGIAFLTQPRHLSPLVSRLRVETSSRTDAEWDMDFDFQNNRVNASTLLANYHIGQVTVGGGDAILQIPSQTAITTSRFCRSRYASINFAPHWDMGVRANAGSVPPVVLASTRRSKLLQFVSAQTTYNWDCCGMTVEYRSYTVANVRNENLFRFTFTLANIGGFGSLRPQERLY